MEPSRVSYPPGANSHDNSLHHQRRAAAAPPRAELSSRGGPSRTRTSIVSRAATRPLWCGDDPVHRHTTDRRRLPAAPALGQRATDRGARARVPRCPGADLSGLERRRSARPRPDRAVLLGARRRGRPDDARAGGRARGARPAERPRGPGRRRPRVLGSARRRARGRRARRAAVVVGSRTDGGFHDPPSGARGLHPPPRCRVDCRARRQLPQPDRLRAGCGRHRRGAARDVRRHAAVGDDHADRRADGAGRRHRHGLDVARDDRPTHGGGPSGCRPRRSGHLRRRGRPRRRHRAPGGYPLRLRRGPVLPPLGGRC